MLGARRPSGRGDPVRRDVRQPGALHPDRATGIAPQADSGGQGPSAGRAAGAAPNISPYLLRAADGARETLLLNLLQNEIDAAGSSAKVPGPRSTSSNCRGMRAWFARSSSSTTSVGSGTRSDPSAGISDSAPLVARRLGDYHLLRELGRGGMGVVFEAIHVHRGNRVALKMLPQVEGAHLYRFKPKPSRAPVRSMARSGRFSRTSKPLIPLLFHRTRPSPRFLPRPLPPALGRDPRDARTHLRSPSRSPRAFHRAHRQLALWVTTISWVEISNLRHCGMPTRA